MKHMLLRSDLRDTHIRAISSASGAHHFGLFARQGFESERNRIPIQHGTFENISFYLCPSACISGEK
jgi:hypothetical protein